MRAVGLCRLCVPVLVILMAGLAGCGGAPTGGGSDELPVGCLVKPDPGPCRSNQLGFYYDYRDDRCKAFTYGGCAGRVPFPTLQHCLDFCGAKR
ncbi:BPTI/Kunitz domain-containing protein [Thiocapsa roseopersicina]|uniref:Trypsin inhibitor domain-containing protein n=1 Tax=Thiocapsa roseopersicina TaxID=1058 RepID=A0A1H2VUD5_THIRO|nr:BPTI/Kunitz domain-containing protein [Thiocapsa roseopersicina]SDW71847.1 trypsin inhibitor domain-containing protein [Thiocapsa roseopersicina]